MIMLDSVWHACDPLDKEHMLGEVSGKDDDIELDGVNGDVVDGGIEWGVEHTPYVLFCPFCGEKLPQRISEIVGLIVTSEGELR